jgi:RNA polymerase sigma factor (sigma-70 family)
MLSEQELIQGCARGDSAIQKALYDRYCRKMMVIGLRYTRSQAEAEDVLQDGFIKVFAHLHSFRGESKLETWITRIMIRTALNHQRQKLYLLPIGGDEETEPPVSEEINLADFHLTELISIVQSLPVGCRLVFNLFAIEGYSHKEIAAMLGISEGTSKSQYNRAKQLLRIKLTEQGKMYRKYGERRT